MQVSPSVDAWYPLGAAACCTPALLLASGDAWELERCGCAESTDVNCGGTASQRLLSGYQRWRCARDPSSRSTVGACLVRTLFVDVLLVNVCYVCSLHYISLLSRTCAQSQ